MADFERGFTPPAIEKVRKESEALDMIVDMMIACTSNPEHKTDLLILRTGKEAINKIHLLLDQTQVDTSAEKKQEILEYMTAVKGGLDTFIETSNLKSEE